ncbi:sensor histidine kinase [Persicitalea jodogahamensis]|uniref:histidine kinase n=1 Tax=Persicitalea jodogahamensis TaxID=402147 RepID=A0A8J3D8L2_9BACT|nr:ATP-binding protein [Persicitalea jodogahamensis]GHB68880.1 hypothetical protein GCM10007390_22950 [Persicitalea jodogahamensis]
MPDPTALLPGGVLVLDAESRIITINPYACTLLGYDEADLLGEKIDRLLTTASRIYFQTHLYPLITLQKAADELYLTLQTRERIWIPVLLNVSTHDQDGEIRTYYAFIPVYQRRKFEQELINAKKSAEDALLRNDELRRLQQQLQSQQADLDRQIGLLRHRNDELEQFSKIISHDLQEPLRKINLFADLLTREEPAAFTTMGRRALDGVARSSARLRALITDLQLYFSHDVRSSDKVGVVDTEALVHTVAEEYSAADTLFQVTKLPAVLGDREELIRLFRHLLDNAVKFRHPDRPLTVQISGTVLSVNSFQHLPDKYRYNDYVRIVVADDGIGFDNRYREDIFRIMEKLDARSPGIGLGLALSKKIVEKHNGQISANSEPGQGTQITVLLPVA